MKWAFWRRNKVEDNYHPAVKLLLEMAAIESQVRDNAVVLQHQMESIEETFSGKSSKSNAKTNYTEALDRLHSRFYVYKPLRNLLREFAALWKLHHQLLAMDQKKQIPIPIRAFFNTINKKLSVELNKETVFANAIVRDLSRTGELEDVLEEIVEKVKDNYSPKSEKKVFETVARIKEELAALIRVMDLINQTISQEEAGFERMAKVLPFPKQGKEPISKAA